MNSSLSGDVAGSRSAWSGKALFAVVAWGASFAVTRLALEAYTPAGLVAGRLALGSAVLLLLALARGGPVLPDRGDRAVSVFLGCVLAAHLLIQAHGLQHTSAINTAWIIAFIPVTIAIGAHLFLRQRLRLVGWVGVALATGGVIAVTGSSPREFAHARFGDMLQLVSCLTWTVYTLVAAGPVVRNGSLRVSTMALVTATLVLCVPAVWSGALSGPVGPASLAAMAFLGFVCNGVAYYLWFRAVEEHGATRSGTYIYLEPFVSIAVARLTLAEPVLPLTFVGGAVVLIGVRLVSQGSSRVPVAKPLTRKDAATNQADPG